jgi:hypothetical protein
MERSFFLGGSDLAAILGCSPYTSRRQLWLRKTRQVEEPDLTDNYHIRRGNRLEHVGKQLFVEWARPRNPDGYFLGHVPEIPIVRPVVKGMPTWVGGTPDLEWREPITEAEPARDWVVDVKVMSREAFRAVVDGSMVPSLQYRLQLDWYMHTRGYTGGILWLYCPELDECHHFVVERDDVLGPLYLEEAAAFWAHVCDLTDPGDGPMTPLPEAPVTPTTTLADVTGDDPDAIAALSEAIVNLHGARALRKQAEGLEESASERLHTLLSTGVPGGQHYVGTLLAEGVQLKVIRVESARLDAKLLAERAPLDRDAVLRIWELTGVAPSELAACALDLADCRTTSVSYQLRTSTVTPTHILR